MANELNRICVALDDNAGLLQQALPLRRPGTGSNLREA